MCIAVAWAAALALPLVWPVVRWLYPLPPPKPPGTGLAGLVGLLDVLAEGARAQFVLMVVAGGWLLSLLAAGAAARIARGGSGPVRTWRHRLPALAATLLLSVPLFVQAATTGAPCNDPFVASTGDR